MEFLIMKLLGHFYSDCLIYLLVKKMNNDSVIIMAKNVIMSILGHPHDRAFITCQIHDHRQDLNFHIFFITYYGEYQNYKKMSKRNN